MKFLYPLGLLGLIGIPILILVYIIKNRYTEQTVSSTFMWKLSERFLKRKNPFSKITGIISLILQLLLVLVLSLAVAHPIIVLPGEANEYCFILDGSGSMNMTAEGKTRFDVAKEEIIEIIDNSEDGSVYSLVLVSDMTELVFELEDSKQTAKDKISALECSDSSVDYADSIGVAQGYFNENPAMLTYVLTDKNYEEHKNVNVINVSRGENNISLEDVVYVDGGGGNIIVMGSVISYGAERDTDVEVWGEDTAEPLGKQHLKLIKDTKVPFSITVTAEDFYSLTAKITADDALASDNAATIYNIENENSYKALLVSKTPFMIQTAINAVSVADLAVMTPDEYESKGVDSGYGLYIYDSYSPAVLPTDGSIWFVGPTANVENSGFSIQGEVEIEKGAVELELNKSSNTVMKKLTNGLLGDGIYVKKYVKCGIYGNFSTIFSYMGNPMVFTGENDSGNREVVFAFNFHDTDFTVSPDYLILFYNLLEYSFPAVLEKTEYYCGDMAEVNVIAGCNSIRVEAPSGEAFYAETTSAISEFLLGEIGEYKLKIDISGNEREFSIYSSLPKEERCPEAPVEESLSIRGEPQEGGRDGIYDPMLIILILAAVLFTAEWVVYCYDKYQFR